MKNSIALNYLRYSYTFPNRAQPPWGNAVKRWHQLDAYSFGLIDAFYRFQNQIEKPNMMLFASPYGSNDADYQFVLSNAKKPAKMVHTLPNVRGNPLMKYMGWTGPVLCLQKDPQTILTAISEAIELLDASCGNILIWSGVPCHLMERLGTEPREQRYEVHVFSVSCPRPDEKRLRGSPLAIVPGPKPTANTSLSDEELLKWLVDERGASELPLPSGHSIFRNSLEASDDHG